MSMSKAYQLNNIVQCNRTYQLESELPSEVSSDTSQPQSKIATDSQGAVRYYQWPYMAYYKEQPIGFMVIRPDVTKGCDTYSIYPLRAWADNALTVLPLPYTTVTNLAEAVVIMYERSWLLTKMGRYKAPDQGTMTLMLAASRIPPHEYEALLDISKLILARMETFGLR